MANIRYVGNSVNRKQTDVYTVASPSSGASIYTVTVNGKVYSYTAASSVAADVAQALADDYNSQFDILELPDSPATVSGAAVSFTSKEAGVPFTNTYGVTGGGTFNGTTTISNSGKGVLDTAANWSAAISAADNLIVDLPNINIQFRLTSLTTALTSFVLAGTFNGELGLPIINTAGYPEYRGCYASLAATTFLIGQGDGPGCSRAYINGNAGAAMTVVVYKTGSSQDEYPTVMLKHTSGGSNSFAVVRIVDGSVGIALLPDETATVTSLLIGGDGTNPSVFTGVGCTVASMSIESGSIVMSATPGTSTLITGGASVTVVRGGAATTINVDDGTLVLGGSGSSFTITNLTVGEGGTLDLSQGQGAITVTNGVIVYPGATIIDPLDRLVATTVFNAPTGRLGDWTYIGKPGITFTKS